MVKDNKPKELKVKTPEGTVVSHTSEAEPVPQKITRVSEQERQQFVLWAKEAKSFLNAYTTPQSSNELKQYDEAFKAWQDSDSRQHSDEDVINLIGAYLGQKLIEDLEMEWVLVEDEYGRDYAVRHNEVEVMGFPFSTVMKRVEDNKYDFVHGVYHVLRHRLGEDDLKSHKKSEQRPHL